MKLNTIKNLVKDGARGLLVNRLVSFVAITTVFLALTILGVFYLVVDTTNTNINNFQKQVEVVAFINKGVSEDKINFIKSEIEKMDNVEKVEYISSDKGLSQYKDSFKNDGDRDMQRILDEVVKNEENPIPSSFEITTKSPEANKEVEKKLTTYKEVYKVNDGNIVTEFLQKINKYTAVVGVVLMSVLAVISVVLISNSIKVTVFVRRKEISITKYIGATDNYIRLPFVIEGLLIGLVGSILSIVVVTIVFVGVSPTVIASLSDMMGEFIMPSAKDVIFMLTPISVVTGTLIGCIGSQLSLTKYLNI
ncbi:MAG: permease-like cell division protein FtsX [Clostridium sp.]